MTILLEVEKREVRPRSIKKRLRQEGRIPADVYGYKTENIAISIDEKILQKALRKNGQNAVYTINIDGKKMNVLLMEEQTDALSGKWIYVDFVSVDMKELTEVEAQIVLINDAVGVKQGGMLNQTLYSTLVSATPDKLPETIEVDVSKLEIGQSITIGDLKENKDYTILADKEEQIAAVEERVIAPEPEAEETTTAE